MRKVTSINLQTRNRRPHTSIDMTSQFSSDDCRSLGWRQLTPGDPLLCERRRNCGDSGDAGAETTETAARRLRRLWRGDGGGDSGDYGDGRDCGYCGDGGDYGDGGD